MQLKFIGGRNIHSDVPTDAAQYKYTFYVRYSGTEFDAQEAVQILESIRRITGIIPQYVGEEAEIVNLQIRNMNQDNNVSTPTIPSRGTPLSASDDDVSPRKRVPRRRTSSQDKMSDPIIIIDDTPEKKTFFKRKDQGTDEDFHPAFRNLTRASKR